MRNINIVITGCSEPDNLGYMVARQLKKADPTFHIIALAHSSSTFLEILPEHLDDIVECDLNDETDTVESCLELEGLGKIYCLINCAGLNMNQWFHEADVETFDSLMNVNARATFIISQMLLPQISRAGGTILNIVSNAARVPMRCSLAYNASKAAAKMITKQMAHELTREKNITVFSVSPNKLDGTGMSKFVDAIIPEKRGWTAEFSKQYQANALTTGVETDPEILAEFIAFLLSKKERHFYLSGCDIEYGA